MTDRSPSTDPTDSDKESELVFAYVDGTLDAALRADLDIRLAGDPALRAEVEGLLAIRTLLDKDAQYGRDSQVDLPPSHLLDAILRSEVAARPDEIRQAVALARTSTDARDDASRPLWARFSSWLVGGGVVVSAAAAVLIVVNQGAVELVTPAGVQGYAAVVPAPASSPGADPAATAAAATAAADDAAADDDAADDDAADTEAADHAAGYGRGFAKKASVVDSFDKGQQLSPKEVVTAARAPAPGGPLSVAAFDDGIGKNAGTAAPGVLAEAVLPASAPASAPASSLAAAPVTSGSGGGRSYRSADESKAWILDRMATRRDSKIEKERAQRSSVAAQSAQLNNAPAADGGATDDPAGVAKTPTEAREELRRQRGLDQASELMTAAERELLAGRPLEAIELAGRAEALGGSRVGLVPASTQTRAYFAAKLFADSARVGLRLLQGDPADALIVDGLIAGADAAIAIGDRRLAERLLQRALAPANKDAPRRAQAQRRLERLFAPSTGASAEAAATAPAKAAARAKSAEPSAEADQN